MADELIETVEGGVAVLTLNRPDVLNALDPPLMKALNTALQRCASDAAIACVILTGAGRGFCAGGDIKARARAIVEPDAERLEARPKQSFEDRVAWLRRSMEASRLLHDMTKPTIAMINGACAGAGLALAGACDLRFAAGSAVFTSAFARAGLSGDYGGSYFWTRILGTAKARELFLLAAKFDAEAALSFGLVNRVYPDEALRDEVMKVARGFAEAPRWSAGYIKRNLNLAEKATIGEMLDFEAITQSLSSRNLAEAARDRTK